MKNINNKVSIRLQFAKIKEYIEMILWVLFIILFFEIFIFCEENINISLEIKNLRSKDMTKKFVAIERLAKTKDNNSIKELISYLRTEKSPFIKAKIIETFSYGHNSETIEETIGILKNEKNYDLRYAAVYSLGYAKDPFVVGILIELFLNEDEDLGIRLQAANSLVNYPPTEQIYECFVKGLESKNIDIKIQSIVSLVKSCGIKYKDRVVFLLKKLSEDKNEKLSIMAEEYLKLLDNE